ncbi:hypothetical protein HK098_004037 [Nowakowskiella sp. JEL0407]|nr:hypothetical protein HK098_004037 [Nowakowskiella sp. JEL0407]
MDDNLVEESPSNKLTRAYGTLGSSSSSNNPNTAEQDSETLPLLDNSSQPLDEPRVKVASLTLTLTAIFMGVFLAALDQTIVATIFTAVGSEFNALNNVSWIGTSYLLTQTAFQPLYGRLSDIFGRRFALLSAQSIFLIGSIGCGFARGSIWSLVVWRGIAGIGGGGILTCSNIIMNDLVTLRDRGALQGLGNAVFASAALMGGPLGGFLTDNFSWRWAFLINIPLTLPALICTYIFLSDYNLEESQEPAATKLARIDFPGILSLVTTITSLILVVTLGGNEIPYTHPVILGLGILFVVCFGMFVVVEGRAKEPIVPFRLFKNKTALCVYLLTAFLNMSTISIIFLVPLFLVSVRAQTSTSAGIHLVPKIVASALGSILSGAYIRAFGKYYRVTIFAVSLLVLSDLVITTRWSGTSPEYELYASLVGEGFGFGVPLTTSLIAILSVLSQQDMAVGVALTYTVRSIGALIGLATTQSVFQFALRWKLVKLLVDTPNASEIIETVRKNADAIVTLPPEVATLVREGFNFGFMCAMVLVCCYSVGAFFSWIFVGSVDLVKKDERVKEPQE